MHNSFSDKDAQLIESVEIPVYGPDSDDMDDVAEYIDGYRETHKNNKTVLEHFLGTGPLSIVSHSTPPYYAFLLALAIKRITSSSKWEKVSQHGFSFPEPIYIDGELDYSTRESCLISGIDLLKKGDAKIAVVVFPGRVQVKTAKKDEEIGNHLIQEIKNDIAKNNIYRGKRIILGNNQISFLSVEERAWDSLILDERLKQRIRDNSIGFLNNIDKLTRYGVIPRMGICLAGDPGTGKTAITRAIMSEASSITCISSSPGGMLSESYISELYELAQGLSPSILCIEDIDLLAVERDYHYHGTPTYLALLQEMDGLTAKKPVVTIATTNVLETIDKALLRPPRFSCIVQLPRPNESLRAQIIERLSSTIRVSEDIKTYISKKTKNYTPAEIEGIMHGLAISCIVNGNEIKNITTSDVDTTLSQIHAKNANPMGFNRHSK